MSNLEILAIQDAWREREDREDVRAALIAWSSFGSIGARKKDGTGFSLSDFMSARTEADPEKAKASKALLEKKAEWDLKLHMMRLAKLSKPKTKPTKSIG